MSALCIHEQQAAYTVPNAVSAGLGSGTVSDAQHRHEQRITSRKVAPQPDSPSPHDSSQLASSMHQPAAPSTSCEPLSGVCCIGHHQSRVGQHAEVAQQGQQAQQAQQGQQTKQADPEQSEQACTSASRERATCAETDYPQAIVADCPAGQASSSPTALLPVGITTYTEASVPTNACCLSPHDLLKKRKASNKTSCSLEWTVPCIHDLHPACLANDFLV